MYRINLVCSCSCTYRKMLNERIIKSYFYRELQTYVLGTNAFKLDSALKIFVTPLTISKRWQILIFPRLHDHLPEAPPKDFWTSLFEPYVQNLISDPYSYQIIMKNSMKNFYSYACSLLLQNNILHLDLWQKKIFSKLSQIYILGTFDFFSHTCVIYISITDMF